MNLLASPCQKSDSGPQGPLVNEFTCKSVNKLSLKINQFVECSANKRILFLLKFKVFADDKSQATQIKRIYME